MAKKELTLKEKEAQLQTWKMQLKGLARLVESSPDLEDYTEEDWVWVKGDTKPHKEELKFYGLRFCGRKDSPHYQQWYLAAPKWYTEERRAREAEEAALARVAEQDVLGNQKVLEAAATVLGKLTSSIEEMELDCDAEVYIVLKSLEELLIKAI